MSPMSQCHQGQVVSQYFAVAAPCTWGALASQNETMGVSNSRINSENNYRPSDAMACGTSHGTLPLLKKNRK